MRSFSKDVFGPGEAAFQRAPAKLAVLRERATSGGGRWRRDNNFRLKAIRWMLASYWEAIGQTLLWAAPFCWCAWPRSTITTCTIRTTGPRWTMTAWVIDSGP